MENNQKAQREETKGGEAVLIDCFDNSKSFSIQDKFKNRFKSAKEKGATKEEEKKGGGSLGDAWLNRKKKKVGVESKKKPEYEQRFEDDPLAELNYQRFKEAKNRLRNFVVHSDMKSDPQEKKRLMAFYKHRPYTFINLMNECLLER